MRTLGFHRSALRKGKKKIFEDAAKVSGRGTRASDGCLKRLPARSRVLFFEGL